MIFFIKKFKPFHLFARLPSHPAHPRILWSFFAILSQATHTHIQWYTYIYFKYIKLYMYLNICNNISPIQFIFYTLVFLLILLLDVAVFFSFFRSLYLVSRQRCNSCIISHADYRNYSTEISSRFSHIPFISFLQRSNKLSILFGGQLNYWMDGNYYIVMKCR